MKTNHFSELEILDAQILGTIGVVVSVVISLFIAYNQRLLLTDEEPILDQQSSSDLTLWNRIFLTLVILWFLYFSYDTLIQAKEKNKDVDIASFQFLAAVLALVVSLISLYVLLKTRGSQDTLTNIIGEENIEG